MKYLWILVPLLMTGCASVRYVTTDHGRIVDQNHQQVYIEGNPPMICHYIERPTLTYSGYFMYQKDDGTILLDHFGKRTIFLTGEPVCELKLDTSVED